MINNMENKSDGIYGNLPETLMAPAAKKIRDIYSITPNAPILQKEFGYYSLERWESEGHDVSDTALREAAGLEDTGIYDLGELGWCEAPFFPDFPEKILEDRGKHEVWQDHAGRALLCFKGRRSGFMPDFIDHPVKDIQTWNDLCKWRLDPKDEARYSNLDARMAEAVTRAQQGYMISQRIIGGYMYLRSLIGPEELFYMLYEDPDLIHECMESWFHITDAVASRHQQYLTFDEVFFAEDICYNHGSLISPAMIREFLFPYYKRLLDNIRSRQHDPKRHLYFQVDTDGDCRPVIPLYMELGLDVMSPFEVASGCDVVVIGRQYPNLVMTGGIDKRVLAKGPDAIDEMMDRIMPVMKKRGGYYPTCDHGVPAEVSYENWLHFRKRCREY